MESRWLHYTNKYNRIRNSGTYCNDPCIIRKAAKHSIPLQILLIREKNMTCLSVWKTPSRKCIFSLLISSQTVPCSVGWGRFQTKKEGRCFKHLVPNYSFIVTLGCHRIYFIYFFSYKNQIRKNKNEFVSVRSCTEMEDSLKLRFEGDRHNFWASVASVKSAGI